MSLVLGAGNVASIPPTDVLYKMFVEGKVCMLKMNPVNAHVGPFVERAFAAAIDKGWLAVSYGGPDVGKYLVEHEMIDEIHITGSDKTHDMMVWGPPGPEREARKQKKEPLLKKEITSELGNVSPVIVVPGPYSDAELAFQGESITAAIANNASFNCNSAKLLVAPKGWDGTPKLQAALKAALAKVPVRKAYYPGAEDRWKQLVDSHPSVERIGDAQPGTLQWAIIKDVDSAKTDDKVFSMEPWCSIISETTIGSSDPVAFLEEAVKFVNDQVWGTLSATLIVHPSTMKDPKFAAALDKAVQDLRYGTVAINHWPALGFAFGVTPWGGHPSSTLEDIPERQGSWVHNTYMLNDDDMEKCVIRGPLVVKPKPPWFAACHKIRARDPESGWSRWRRRRRGGKLPGIVMKARLAVDHRWLPYYRLQGERMKTVHELNLHHPGVGSRPAARRPSTCGARGAASAHHRGAVARWAARRASWSTPPTWRIIPASPKGILGPELMKSTFVIRPSASAPSSSSATSPAPTCPSVHSLYLMVEARSRAK